MHHQEVRLFNTQTRQIEPLNPIIPGEIGIYCCGPTVYNFQHIGNLRTYIFEDLLVRTLRYAGYKVRHVMNITDVGHLVSDADAGEDKMLLASKREGKRSEDIAEYYSKIFFDHCGLLNIQRPDVVCKATEHIQQMIELIITLEKKDIAYLSGGNVYFDVSKLSDYGKLAGLNLETLQAGARIEVDDQKRNPHDFALWFTKSKFENQELQWDSPWGRGYPGWHIECSAMAMHYLGECFDIHCGGIDHIPVHHTNEIAQSEGATGKPFVSVWMHGGFLVTGKDKMSKSTGEFLTLDRVCERGFDPLSYRLMCLSGTYRNELSWSWEALEGASNALKKIKSQVLALKAICPDYNSQTTSDKIISKFNEAIFNDLKMPIAVSLIHETLNDDSLSPSTKLATLSKMDAIFALGVDNWVEEKAEIPTEVLQLASDREIARKSRDFKTADALRAQITALGYTVEDSAHGPHVKKL